MVVLSFMLCLLVLFVVGIVCMIVGVIGILLNRRGKKQGKTKKKIRHVIPVGVLMIGILAVMAPFAWLMMVRFSNGQTDSDYVETKTMVTWDDTREISTFTYKGDKYVPIILDHNPSFIEINYGMKKPDAAFNIKQDKSILGLIFNADEKDVMYQV